MEYSKLTDLLKVMSTKKAEERFVSEISSGKEYTYEQFYVLVQERAEYMRQKGIKPVDKVGLIYKNSIEFMIDFFAILENDAIVVPINAALKDRELAYIFQDANLRYVIISYDDTRVDILSKIIQDHEMSDKVRFIEIDNNVIDDSRIDNLIKDTALILYTSGSTGKAKGVMLTHFNLLSEMQNIKEAHALVPSDRVLCVLPWFHINGLVITMLTPLLVGHEIFVAEKFSQSRFWDWVDAYQISWFSGVPTIYAYLLTSPDYKPHPSLRFARSASSPLPVRVLEKFEERYQVPVIESYGMTEGGSQLTSNPLPPDIRKPGSVGIPYGLNMRIVNEAGEICSEGETGEVEFQGNSITSGYYKKEKETSETLEQGWLKTGDLGYLDSDGYLFLEGRKKELINRSGEKFSPREIDEILYQYKGIKMAAAVGVPDEFHGEEVVAFCVPEENVELTEDELITFCKKYLADYKVPKKLIFVGELPIGGNGKVQRLKLVDEYKEMGK